jgi:Flp pilus assembly protein TadG
MHPRRHLAAARLRHHAYAGDREAGVASIQIVVLMPVLFLLMFIGMQAAIIYHGRTVAIAAAQEGARAAAAQNGTATAGQSAATAFVVAAGGEGTLRVSPSPATGPPPQPPWSSPQPPSR